VSHTAILNNAEAKNYYKQYRSWKGVRSIVKVRTNGSQISSLENTLPRIKLDRDLARVRGRYMRLSKRELVEKLIWIEQLYAEQEERHITTCDDLLHLKLQNE
jgi:hypothetical protein